jgi:uncharacterized membrane protein (UPF0127 family)
MRKVTIFLLTLIIFLCLFMAFLLKNNQMSYVKIDGKQFFVDVAKTDEQKAKGLDIYDKLPVKKGMIFTFQTPDYYPFWMKGMKFPIDIIYINNNKIVDIFENLPNPKTDNETPVMVKPQAKSNFILEINAGLSHKYNFKTGDRIEIHL